MSDFDFEELAHRLHQRQRLATQLPIRRFSEQFLDQTLELIFPNIIVGDTAPCTDDDVNCKLESAQVALEQALAPVMPADRTHANDAIHHFFNHRLMDLIDRLWLDAEAIFMGDPAAASVDEVISTYPGLLGVAIHRIAHEFYLFEVPVFPRMLSEIAHRRTGIDIHPGARIGESFCIDHGTGIVIGETAILGNNVKLYQGVTLGALSVRKNLASSKRHPTIEDNVVIYANATILGGETVIGHHSVIGGNVWLTESLPPYSIVQHKAEVHLRNRLDEMVPFNFVI